MQAGGVIVDESAARTAPAGTAHAVLKGEINPRSLHAARQNWVGNSNVGDASDPVGASDAQGRTQANQRVQSSRAQQDKLQHAQMQCKTKPFKG